MLLTLLQELKTLRQIALVAHEQEAAILFGLVMLLLPHIDLGSVLDPTANDPVRIDARLRIDVSARVHLPYVRRERTLLLGCAVEGEDIVSLRVSSQLGVVLQRGQLDWRTRLPPAGKTSPEELAGVDAWVIDIGCFELEEAVELGHQLLQVPERQETPIQCPRGAACD